MLSKSLEGGAVLSAPFSAVEDPGARFLLDGGGVDRYPVVDWRLLRDVDGFLLLEGVTGAKVPVVRGCRAYIE